MVVAETITAISLVRSAVKGIKSCIKTAEDLGEISGYIDQMMDGHEKLKEADKPPTRAQQWGSLIQNKLGKSKDKTSLGAVAQAHIDRLYAEEAIESIALAINKRFGFSTWENILLERSELISEEKKKVREKKEADTKFQKKLIEWVGGGVVVLIGVIGMVLWINYRRKF